MTNASKYSDNQTIVGSLETLKLCLGIRLTGVKLEVVNDAYKRVREFIVEREPELVTSLISLWNSSGRKFRNGELAQRLQDYEILSCALQRSFQDDYKKMRCFARSD